MGGSVNVLQVGDLCLDEPLLTVSSSNKSTDQYSQQCFAQQCCEEIFVTSSVPARFRNNVTNARFLATEKLFSAAVAEQVDLLLIAGKLCRDELDSRSFWFLRNEFKKLADHGITVVCVETSDLFAWPASIECPQNLRVLTRSQSIGFRVGEHRHSVEIDWAQTDSAQDLEPHSDVCLQLHETAGTVTEITYSSPDARNLAVVAVHPLQNSSQNEAEAAHGTLMTIESRRQPQVVVVPTAEISWETLEVDAADGVTAASLRKQILTELGQFRTAGHHNSTKTLLSVSIKGSASRIRMRDDFDLDTLLHELQNDSELLRANVWMYRIAVTDKFERAVEMSPLHIALQQLDEMQLDDAYENLDVHVLEIDRASFQRLKTRVARRLPELLTSHTLSIASNST